MPKPIEFEKGRRIYLQIAEQLREEISDGTLKVGSEFPSENELTKIYRVARGTIRDARSVLEREGLVEPQRGKRHTIVKKPGGNPSKGADQGTT